MREIIHFVFQPDTRAEAASPLPALSRAQVRQKQQTRLVNTSVLLLTPSSVLLLSSTAAVSRFRALCCPTKGSSAAYCKSQGAITQRPAVFS